MKGLIILASLASVTALGLTACSDDGNLGAGGYPTGPGTSSGDPSIPTGNNDPGVDTTKPVEDLAADVTATRTLSASKNYLLKGLVRVKAGTTLTIEKGTTIFGDTASKGILLVEAGAKIMAEGTAEEPIVFTSQAAADVRSAGNWGGIVILGNAPVNFPGGKGNIEGILTTASGTQFGGSDPNDDSGVLRYIRVEYAGILLSGDNEVNGLTFGGVGRGTKVDHIQVRHALDDCFEFFGGTVDAHHLACQWNQDDGFDFDNGYSGRLQFLVLQQDPKHPGEDNGFESDNDAQGSANTPLTSPTVFNATICGKNADPASAQFGLLARRNTRGSYNNVIFHGFEASVDVRDPSTAAGAKGGSLSIKGSLFFGAVGTGVVDHMGFRETGGAAPDKDNDGAFDEIEWLKGGAKSNRTMDPGIQCFDPKAPKFGPASAIVEGAVAPPNDGFFDASATYVGAFEDATDTWATAGKWASWDDR